MLRALNLRSTLTPSRTPSTYRILSGRRFTCHRYFSVQAEQIRTTVQTFSLLHVRKLPRIMAEVPDQYKDRVIDGKMVAQHIRDEIKEGVKLLKEKSITPCVAVVLVGDRKDSGTYVRMKKNAAEELGMDFVLKHVPASVQQADLLKVVQELNADPKIHGLIVQLPLPAHIIEHEILDAVSVDKDVDGIHPWNVGQLAMKGRKPLFSACTPTGCMAILDYIGVNVEGKHVVVLGRSNIVGTPFSLLCLHRNATVTMCHSKTVDLQSYTRQADILLAAVGKPEMVKKDWVKPGAVVIDVGTNSVDDPTRKLGYRLVGDVAFKEVIEVASKITPVPGGVGPMTVTMLLKNTLAAAGRVAKSQHKDS